MINKVIIIGSRWVDRFIVKAKERSKYGVVRVDLWLRWTGKFLPATVRYSRNYIGLKFQGLTQENSKVLRSGKDEQNLISQLEVSSKAKENIDDEKVLEKISENGNYSEKDVLWESTIRRVAVAAENNAPDIKLTDTQCVEETKKLISDLNELVTLSYTNPSLCTKPLQKLCDHLHKYPWKAGAVTKDHAVRQILLLVHICDGNNEVNLLGREALGLLGYHDPPSARGPRILSIDGGGTRGLIALKILKAIEEGTGKRIHELFDLICGVSTGAILAVLLGLEKMPIEDAEKIYHDISIQIFKQNVIYGNIGWVSRHSYYDTKFFEDLLQNLCFRCGHDILMSDFYRSKNTPKIAIVAAEVTETHVLPYVFRTYQLPRKTHTSYKGSSRYPLWASLRASTAAPGYFGDFKCNDTVFQDGSVILNNPTQIAIHEARKIWPDYNLQCVVSIGLGRPDKFMQEEKYSASSQSPYAPHMKNHERIVNSATDTELVHLSLEDSFLKNPGVYYRFNPYLKEFTSIDEIRQEQFNMFNEYSRMYIRRNHTKFSDAAYQLTKGKGPHHSFKQNFKIKWDLIKSKYF